MSVLQNRRLEGLTQFEILNRKQIPEDLTNFVKVQAGKHFILLHKFHSFA